MNWIRINWTKDLEHRKKSVFDVVRRWGCRCPFIPSQRYGDVTNTTETRAGVSMENLQTSTLGHLKLIVSRTSFYDFLEYIIKSVISTIGKIMNDCLNACMMMLD